MHADLPYPVCMSDSHSCWARHCSSVLHPSGCLQTLSEQSQQAWNHMNASTGKSSPTSAAHGNTRQLSYQPASLPHPTHAYGRPGVPHLHAELFEDSILLDEDSAASIDLPPAFSPCKAAAQAAAAISVPWPFHEGLYRNPEEAAHGMQYSEVAEASLPVQTAAPVIHSQCMQDASMHAASLVTHLWDPSVTSSVRVSQRRPSALVIPDPSHAAAMGSVMPLLAQDGSSDALACTTAHHSIMKQQHAPGSTRFPVTHGSVSFSPLPSRPLSARREQPLRHNGSDGGTAAPPVRPRSARAASGVASSTIHHNLPMATIPHEKSLRSQTAGLEVGGHGHAMVGSSTHGSTHGSTPLHGCLGRIRPASARPAFGTAPRSPQGLSSSAEKKLYMASGSNGHLACSPSGATSLAQSISLGSRSPVSNHAGAMQQRPFIQKLSLPAAGPGSRPMHLQGQESGSPAAAVVHSMPGSPHAGGMSVGHVGHARPLLLTTRHAPSVQHERVHVMDVELVGEALRPNGGPSFPSSSAFGHTCRSSQANLSGGRRLAAACAAAQPASEAAAAGIGAKHMAAAVSFRGVGGTARGTAVLLGSALRPGSAGRQRLALPANSAVLKPIFMSSGGSRSTLDY